MSMSLFNANTPKLALSVGAYLVASVSVATLAQKKNFSHVFRQLGSHDF